MWGVAVAMPYIFVVNGEEKWYNQIGILEFGGRENEY